MVCSNNKWQLIKKEIKENTNKESDLLDSYTAVSDQDYYHYYYYLMIYLFLE